ncbi:MAG: hypothetical protein H0W88_07340 [Parachlamydiaceae bacterium]|nr:hypothetical protein [Parachlamydiaceae bacterium]
MKIEIGSNNPFLPQPLESDIKIHQDIYDIDLDIQHKPKDQDDTNLTGLTAGRACSATCASCQNTCGNCQSVQRVCRDINV